MNLVRSLYALLTAVAAVTPVYGDGSSAVDCTKAENIVKCVRGMAVDGNGDSLGWTCSVECDGKCCVGLSTCSMFTGSVCKDGSCMEGGACRGAGINGHMGLISGASCVGHHACMDAAKGNAVTKGSIDSISGGSCIGQAACRDAGYTGSVGTISNGSCIGHEACHWMGSYTAIGDVTFLNNCCKSDQECMELRTDADLPGACAAPPPTTTTTTTTIAATTAATTTATTATVPATTTVTTTAATTTIAATTTTTSTNPPPLPWIINFNSFNGNFTLSSNEEITLVYLASLNRTVQVDALQMKGCEVNVSAANAELVISNVTKTDHDNTTQKITVTHDINMTLLGNSSIYNATTNKLNVCQRVKLVLETDDSNMMTIVEDVREIEVDFNLDFNYSISDTALEAAANKQNKTETNVDNYIEAYKCNPGDDYSRDNNDHAPNTKIHLCIRSISSDVLIDKLESMTATEQTSGVNIVLIENKESIKYPAITSLDRMDVMSPGPGPGVVVSTFLPFEPSVYDGKSKVDITGTISMKLTGSPDARRLQADTIDSVGAGANAASFDIKVNLQQNIASAEDPIVSTGMIVSNGFRGLVLVVTPLYMMMW